MSINVEQDSGPVLLRNVVISSFSFGIEYMEKFLRFGRNLPSYLREVWDFDGQLSNAPMALGLRSLASGARFVQYDQGGPNVAFHLPLPRWSGYRIGPEGPPHDFKGVHKRMIKTT